MWNKKETFELASPWEVNQFLCNIEDYLNENIENIKRMRIRTRCTNCLRVIGFYDVFFDNKVVIDGFTVNCNLGNKKTNFHYVLDGFNYPLANLEEHEDNEFQLMLRFYDGLNFKIPLSAYFADEFVIHGRMAYKDNKIKAYVKNYNKKVILALQSFIDFHGLRPMYSNLLIIEYK